MAQTVKRATIAEYNGQVVISDIVKRKTTVPIFSTNETYSATLVTSWYDGSPMDDSKADGSVYFKLKALPQGADPAIYGQYIGSYFKVNLPNDGNSFLEKDTVQEIRDLSATELLLLKMGYYKGVKLNGYYQSGDTPSPTEYVISETLDIDNGGSVIQVEDLKLTHDFGDYIHVSYFGVKGDDSVDRTTEYNNIVKASVENGIVEWYAGKNYHGSFVSDKSLILQGNFCELTNSNISAPLIRFQGDVNENVTTVVAGQTLGFGNVLIPVVSVSGISVGDLISIHDEKLRPSNNQVINYETLVVKFVDVDNNYIEVHDMIRSSQNTGVIHIDVIKNPLKDIRVNNFKLNPNNTHTGSLLFFEGVNGANTSSIETSDSVGNGIGARFSVSVNTIGTQHNPARLVGDGQGYGSAFVACRDVSIFVLKAFKMRHAVDYSACYSTSTKSVLDLESESPIQIAHNTFGGNMIFEDITVDGQSYAALHVQGQGLDNPGSHIFRDLKIRNVTHVWRVNTAFSRVIRLESSVDNIDVDGVNLINNIPDYNKDDIEDSIVSITRGSISGNVNIRNLRANVVGTAFIHTLGTAVQPNIGLVSLDDVRVDECMYGFRFEGTRRVKIDNLRFTGAIEAGRSICKITPFLQSLLEASIGSNVSKDSIIPFFDADPNSLLEGLAPVEPASNNTRITAVSNLSLTRADLDSRTQLLLNHNFSGNLTMTSPKVIPDPQFFKEEFLILLNTPADLGTKGSMIIPSSNTNIINPEGGFGVTIRSGEMIRLVSGILDGVKVWFVDRLSRQASDTVGGLVKLATQAEVTAGADASKVVTPATLKGLVASATVKGLVNQATALASISQADLETIATPDATDEATLITLANALKAYINANVVPLTNAIKTSQNTELTNQRTAGQQAT